MKKTKTICVDICDMCGVEPKSSYVIIDGTVICGESCQIKLEMAVREASHDVGFEERTGANWYRKPRAVVRRWFRTPRLHE